MEPIDPPCCAGNLNLKGTIVLEIAVDADGKPTCTEMVSENPLIATSAIHSVSNWKFEPYVVQGQHKPFCGKLAIRFHATERKVKFKTIEVP